MHLSARCGGEKVKYASEMPIFKIAFEETCKNKKSSRPLTISDEMRQQTPVHASDRAVPAGEKR
jgi:hypothetical protein